LGPDSLPEDEVEKLKKALSAAETDISNTTKSFDHDFGWSEALPVSQASQKKEMEFLDAAHFLRISRLDLRYFVRTEYLKARLSYLLMLKVELDNWSP